MKSFFSWLTGLSLRFRAVTLILAVVVTVLGLIATSQLQQELLPPIEFPQTIILAQVSGMTSDEVLNVVTSRVEVEIDTIPEIVNIESTTTGSFGAVITARNDFGLNQNRIQSNVQDAINRVWLPLRSIQTPEGTDAQAFSAQLLSDLTPDVLVYLAERESNFLFQLAPETWASFSDETLRAMMGYLASQVQETEGSTSALQLLVEQDIVPQLEALDIVARVEISGGQALPDESGAMLASATPVENTEAQSLLLSLSSEAWDVISARLSLGELNADAVTALSADAPAIPESAPALPESWQMNHFSDATDLQEMRSLTRTVAGTLNQFQETGSIVGALGQTNDLTAETITQMLEIAPTMVQHFEADQLAALSEEAFAALPDEYIAGLDGFTRDALAAAALAKSITGTEAEAEPVALPNAWRIAPPQLITFSFGDLPLATFSVFATGEATAAAPPDETAAATTEETVPTTDTAAETPVAEETVDIPEGPGLPLQFALIGTFLGTELNTADDLIPLTLPENLAEQFGASSLPAAQFFNFLTIDPATLPEGSPSLPIDGQTLISSISPAAIQFIAQNDPTFSATLSDSALSAMSDEVLMLPEISPALAQVWSTLAEQPQFEGRPLASARDLLNIGEGNASTVLNTINSTVPERFAGYEVRLFDSLTPTAIRFFTLNEPDFFASIDANALAKFSPTALALVPEDILAGLDDSTQTTVRAILAGDQPSAATELAALYATDVPPADPDAPALNPEWSVIGNFLNTELDTADDLFRFFPSASGFINGFFDSAQGANFAPSLLGGMTQEMLDYMIGRDPAFVSSLRNEALTLFTPELQATFPADVQERLASGGEAFKPTDPVTRANGNSSLLVTVYKQAGTNTVSAFHQADEILKEIDAERDDIGFYVAFEQAEFIEESISGVAREGGLGAIFAVVVILVFLSSGSWSRNPRRIVGGVMVALFLIGLALVTVSNMDAAGGDLTAAFNMVDVVVRVLLGIGVIAGFMVMFWPGNLPYPAWRSTLVTAVSIPLSVLIALALMRWLPGSVNGVLAPSAEGSAILGFILRLFPESITLNIMTLSGLTVAIGRVVDDSIVVLENIFRQIQEGGDKQQAVLQGTRDVSVAIFTATLVTVVVFLPLGLTGGIIGAFFLPFGLAVTYALVASFIVAITVIPVLAYLFVNASDIAEEDEHGPLERLYLPVLGWSLAKGLNQFIVLVVAFASMLFGFALLGGRPTAFLPSFGEPQIAVTIEMPTGTKIVDTNVKVVELEQWINENVPAEDRGTVLTTVGGSGASLESLITGGGGVTENAAAVTIGITTQSKLDAYAQAIRTEAQRVFGEGNVVVSAASVSEQGFGGFELVLAGPQDQLEAFNDQVIQTLNDVTGLANAGSTLSQVSAGGSENAPTTYILIDRESAVRYTGELETENTLGVTRDAKAAVTAIPGLQEAGISVSEGFNTELQTQGFANLAIAILIAIAIVIVILMITFGSLVHWLDIILSIIVAPVGAAIALTLTNRVLGISAMIGMLMLVGIVVTNAVVLIDRVNANRRERRMNVHDALMEAGGRRLRPIVMTALATIFALMPLAIGLSEGAIIASELGTVVIGGLLSSTLLTLIVVPVAYSLLSPVHKAVMGLFGRADNH